MWKWCLQAIMDYQISLICIGVFQDHSSYQKTKRVEMVLACDHGLSNFGNLYRSISRPLELPKKQNVCKWCLHVIMDYQISVIFIGVFQDHSSYQKTKRVEMVLACDHGLSNFGNLYRSISRPLELPNNKTRVNGASM